MAGAVRCAALLAHSAQAHLPQVQPYVLQRLLDAQVHAAQARVGPHPPARHVPPLSPRGSPPQRVTSIRAERPAGTGPASGLRLRTCARSMRRLSAPRALRVLSRSALLLPALHCAVACVFLISALARTRGQLLGAGARVRRVLRRADGGYGCVGARPAVCRRKSIKQTDTQIPTGNQAHGT